MRKLTRVLTKSFNLVQLWEPFLVHYFESIIPQFDNF